jgi:phenylacetate-coenzyme A ligase PaaK-like adenylate-forming protein
MTKTDLMNHWDEIVCDRRLSLAIANNHIEQIGRDGPAYLQNTYHAAATGGTTGHRGVMVWDFEGIRLTGSRMMAWGSSVSQHLQLPIAPPMTAVNIGSSGPVHLGATLAQCFSNPALLRTVAIAASTPIEEILARLEELKPQVLAGYASMLQVLAEQKLAGRLSIEPFSVAQAGEPFLPEAQALVAKAFPGAIRDIWGSTEVGLAASSFPGFDGLIVSEDLVIVEPVDSDGRPVAFGQRAAKVFVTNLANRVLPIIRYEISDEVTLQPTDPDCPWSGVRLTEIHGRQDDVFEYAAGRRIHPHTFRSVMTRFAGVSEYQVHQTARGARVLLVPNDRVDDLALQNELTAALARAGLDQPDVQVERVAKIERHAHSQKLKRFIRVS